MVASRPVHVVMFVRNPFTHDARVTREARTLARAGMRVTVLAVRADPALAAREETGDFTVERLGPFLRSLRRPAPASSPSSKNGRPAGGFVRDVALMAARTTSTIAFDRAAGRRAAKLQPDVYHCHDFNTLLAGRTAAWRTPAPIVYDSHELYAHLNVAHPTAMRRRTVELVERRWIRRAAAVITVSDGFADHLASRYGITRPTVVMNVPDVSHAPATVEIPLPLRQPGTKLLYIGGIQRARGLEQAIRALPDVPGARLILLGPSFPDEEARLRALTGALGLTERVSILPAVPHEAVTAVSRHATVALMPFQDVGLSHRLTLPNKLFEAIHAGLPVVASDFPEMRRIVTEHRLGVVCDAGDPAAIAAAVRSITEDPARLAACRAGVRAAAAVFTWEREQTKLLGLYEPLVRGLVRNRPGASR